MCSTNCLILVRSEVVQTLLATGQTGAVRTGLRTIFSLHTLLATELYLGVWGSKEECKQKNYNFCVWPAIVKWIVYLPSFHLSNNFSFELLAAGRDGPGDDTGGVPGIPEHNLQHQTSSTPRHSRHEGCHRDHRDSNKQKTKQFHFEKSFCHYSGKWRKFYNENIQSEICNCRQYNAPHYVMFLRLREPTN